jgi:hypothetical protein
LEKVKISIKSNSVQTLELEAGTLLFPDPKISDFTKTLIIKDSLIWVVSEGYSDIELETYCFNQELKAPSKQMYALTNIKSVGYRKGMSQGEVWEITKKMKSAVIESQKEN